MRLSWNNIQIATAIAVLFHSIGLIGILVFKSDIILQTSWLNLLLMAGLLVYTQAQKNIYFFLFIFACFITGMSVEWIGTKTGMLFGDYAYGDVLGPAIMGVPIIIGFNWFTIVSGCGILVENMLRKLPANLPEEQINRKTWLKTLAVIVDGATLAVAFDWLMEPVAVKLGYWTWHGDGSIPVFNYICWMAISMLLLWVFRLLPFRRENKFAIHLLLIQAMFFLLLRTFL